MRTAHTAEVHPRQPNEILLFGKDRFQQGFRVYGFRVYSLEFYGLEFNLNTKTKILQ